MLTNLPPLLKLDDLTLDTVQQVLRRGDEQISLEPRIFDVLCYLLVHRERFVSLQELHEQVWSGRVVSDTAVRRTISKLRLALADTDTNEPRYIKSLMKRGYQLICSVETIAVDSDAAEQVEAVFLNKPTVANADNATKSLNVLAPDKQRYLLLLLLSFVVVVLIAITFLGFNNTTLISQPDSIASQSAERITFSPGQKVDLAISSNGQVIVFTGNDGFYDAWRLFFYDRESGQTTLIPTAGGNSISSVSFIEQDQRIAYVDSTFGNSAIYALDINANKAAELLLDNFFAIGSLLYHPSSNSLIFGGTKQQGDNGHFYRLDLANGSYEQITFSSQAHVMDLAGSLSPDQLKLLIIRYQLGNHQPVLQIYRLADRELLIEYELAFLVQQSHWLDDEQVLLLTRDGSLEHITLNSGVTKPWLLNVEQPLRRFVLHQNDIYGISRGAIERHFVEADWPDRKNMKLFPSAQTISAHYQKDGSNLWIIQSKQGGFNLSSYDPIQFKERFVFKQQTPFEYIDQHPDGDLLLLKSDNRLWLHNTLDNSRLAISMHGQIVERGYFSQSGKEIIFTVSKGGGWLSYRYILNSGMMVQFNRGYRVMYPWGDYFLAITAAGEISLLNSDFQQIADFPVLMVFDVPYLIQAYDDGVLISNMQMQQTKIWMLSNQLTLQNFDFPRNQLHPNVSIRADGKQLIYYGVSVGNDQVFRVDNTQAPD